MECVTKLTRRDFHTIDTHHDQETGERHQMGRWRRPDELGTHLGRGGILMGGQRRQGARLSAAERKEYIRLIEQITTEENDWAHGEHTEPTTRPEDRAAASILAAERDRLGRQIYLTRWTNGEEKWGPRDTTDHDGPGDPRGGSGLRKRRTTKTPGPSHREPPAREGVPRLATCRVHVAYMSRCQR